jgi:Xaa-Pro dipeptidase
MAREILQRNRELFSRINKKMVKRGRPPLSALVISNREDAGRDRTFFVVTGIYRGMFVYSTAVVFRDGSVKLLVSELEEQEAVKAKLPYEIILPGKNTLKKILGRRKTIGINGKSLCCEFADRLKRLNYRLVNVSEDIINTKILKTSAELKNLKKACEITAVTANIIPGLIKEGISELELAGRVEFEMRKQGCREPAFPTIVAFGRNSAVPHHSSSKARLRKKQLILVDFGARYGQMNADITRMYVLGKADPKQKRLYHHVLQAQRFALSRIRQGVEGLRLSRKVVDMVNGYNKGRRGRGCMNHSLGHSIGVDTHDGRILGGEESFKLPCGLTTTVEPGLYIPGWGGIRIEDDVLVTRRGIVNLTKKAYKDTLIEV